MARKPKKDDPTVTLTAGGKSMTTTLGALEARTAEFQARNRKPRPARESTFEVSIAGVPWNSGGSERSVKLEVVHGDGRPDGMLMFLTLAGRGAVDVTLRANRVESDASWRGIALIDSATWKPGGDGKKSHPSLSIKMSVSEDANNGPTTLRNLVRFRLGLGDEGLQAVEMSLTPYDGPLFPVDATEALP
jgi:hypothetical protein